MEPITIAQKIQERIDEIDMYKNIIFEAATKKAKTKKEYAKACVLTKLQLKNGTIDTWEGEKVGKINQSAADSMAKEMNYQLLFEAEEADAHYKSVIVCIESTVAQMNGLQSINRHLEREK